MADRYPERILQRLLLEFRPASSTPSPGRAPSLEIRLKMGEVLMRASRAMGNITSEVHLSLICLISAFAFIFSRLPADDFQYIFFFSPAPGDLAPHLGYPLVGVFLQGTKDPDQSIRASSLSNLGVLCQRLDYSLGPLAQEV